MICFADYCDADAFFLIKKLDFSNDMLTIQKFVRSLMGAGGGDPEEAAELALLEARTYYYLVLQCRKIELVYSFAQLFQSIGHDW